MKRKEMAVEVQESTPTGGRIRISTGALDRQSDRVLSSGAQIDNYMRNPVVQWGHNYYDPWATIGETLRLEIDNEGITAEFTLRDAANESDPMHIVRALWNQGFIRAASIGFNPTGYVKNDDGGYDFTEWELLEWSLVPVPANQEALRLAVKGLDTEPERRQIKIAWSCGLGHEHETKEEAEQCIRDQQALATPDANAPEPTETKDENTELSPEVLALPDDVIKQLSETFEQLNALWEVHHV